jgi:iron complex outermembrane receptor protein
VFQNTPRWVANVTATWSADVAGGRLSLTPSLSLRDSYSQFEIPNPLLDQPSFVLVDASAVWESADRRWSLGVHGRNLTDELYKIGGYNFPGALFGDSVIAFYGPPRTVTGTLGFRF